MILGVMSFLSLNDVEKHYEYLIVHDLGVLQNAQKLQKLVVDAETGQRGYIITQDESFLEPYRNGVSEFNLLIEIEKELVSDNPPQLKRLEKIEQLFEKWLNDAAIPEIELTESSIHNHEDNEKAMLLVQQKTGKNILDQMRAEFKIFIDVENDLNDKHFLDTQNIVSNTQSLILIVLTLSILFAIFISLKISNVIQYPILRLESLMKSVERGNLSQKISLEGSDEIKSLTNSFLSMLKQIQKTTDLEQQLATSKENEKNSKMIAIGELASRLSHDIRNPLTVIKGTLDILKAKNDSLTDDDLEKLNRMDSSVDRISHQIENVLDFIRGKSLTLSTNSFQKILDSAIYDTIKNDEIKIETKNCNVDLDCDYESIKVVMINLLFNAVQAMGNKGTIKIKTQTRGNEIVIDVQDDGSGIPEDAIKKIFEPLFTTKQEGTGLGLASCKSIIEQHGGKISVQNNPTIFTIILPKKHEN
jgi:signal transduction histidine kinase